MIKRRQTVIRQHQLPSWFDAVSRLKTGQLKFTGRPILVPSGASVPTIEKTSRNSPRHSGNLDRTLEPNSREILEQIGNSSKNIGRAIGAPRGITEKSRESLDISRETSDNVSSLNTAETVADYLLLLIFTGLRRQEAAQLRWENVDLLDRTLTIPDPKNHEPLRLPLSSVVLEMLEERASHAVNEYVFPGTGAEGYLIEPRAAIQCVIETSGVDFTIHDLRRTFITIADSIDIPAYAIKRLVNHKMRGDVTAGYIVSDVERLRRPMQQITDFILKTGHRHTSAEVVAIASHRAIAEHA